MSRWFIAILLFAAINLLLTHSARAELPSLLGRVPLLPSIVPPLPRSVFTAASPGSPATTAVLTPVDNRFLARVSRLLDGLRPQVQVSGRPRDVAARNPTLRDPARDRDATSFGIRSAPMSAGGLGFAGAGVGAGAAQFIDLGKVAKKLPVRFEPTMVQGGGGITLKARW